MSDKEWSRRAEISAVNTTGTSAALNGDIIDMSKYESVLFMGHRSATEADDASCAKLVVQAGTATGSLSDTTGDVAFSKSLVYIDYQRGARQFVRGVIRPGSATVAHTELITMAYGARSLPTTQPASTTGLRLYSPGTGTATG